MKKIRAFTTSIWKWLLELRIGWLGLLVLGPALLYASLPTTNEQRMRFVGVLLQVLGLYTVAHGIWQTRKLFNHPGYLQRFAAWIRRVPRYPIDGAPGRGQVSIGFTLENDLLESGWGSPPPGATVEERIAALETYQQTIDKRLENIRVAIKSKTSECTTAIDAEIRERKDGIKHLQKILEATETGGLDLSVTGLMWIIIGVVLCSVPVELVEVIRATRE